MFGQSWLPSWAGESVWLVPAMGLAVAAAAAVVGRRMLGGVAPRRQPAGEALDGEFLDGVSRDRRSAPRRKGNTVEVQVEVGGQDGLQMAWVLDRSIGGLCVLTDVPLPEGAAVRVRPRKGGEQVPWTEATVKSSRREGGQYETGLQFHRTPSWNLLLQFG